MIYLIVSTFRGQTFVDHFNSLRAAQRVALRWEYHFGVQTHIERMPFA